MSRTLNRLSYPQKYALTTHIKEHWMLYENKTHKEIATETAKVMGHAVTDSNVAAVLAALGIRRRKPKHKDDVLRDVCRLLCSIATDAVSPLIVAYANKEGGR